MFLFGRGDAVNTQSGTIDINDIHSFNSVAIFLLVFLRSMATVTGVKTTLSKPIPTFVGCRCL